MDDINGTIIYIYPSIFDLVWALLAEHEYGEFHEIRIYIYVFHLPTKKDNGGDFSSLGHFTFINAMA